MRSSLGFSIVAALAVADGAGAAEKRAFTILDLYRLKGVEEPTLAPDGKTIVYKVTTSDLGAVKRQANLWRIDPNGANGRALTFADKTDSVPRFSPDGKTLYFLSTRSGESQVWSMSGGEPRKRTDFPGGVGAFTLSGDG
ncbi:MAG TPA: S9 family peptidase, partial [Vicinamibacteria bacterium]